MQSNIDWDEELSDVKSSIEQSNYVNKKLALANPSRNTSIGKIYSDQTYDTENRLLASTAPTSKNVSYQPI